MKKPNIFFIFTEDICPNLGCYGDKNAKTPNLDQFAKENIRFNHCYSAAPVCSAARTSLNLGVFGCTAGVGHHRSEKKLPPLVKNIGHYMQNAGYYTAIGKTDFNFEEQGGYDEDVTLKKIFAQDTEEFTSGMMEVYDKKPEEKPFFVLHTSAITHQSQYGYTEDTQAHRETITRMTKEEWQRREELSIPDYHFDTAEAREIWGQYHEKLTGFDRMFGEFIATLKDKQLYDDAFIFFVGDNGHGIPSGKCNLWNEGVHVPFLLHVPKSWESQLALSEDDKGKYSNRLTTFVDFAATFLSIIEEDIPAHFQGNPLLGKKAVKNPEFAFSFGERVDEVHENSRSIHTNDLLYVCDFGLSPYKRLNTYQTTQAPWFVRSMIEQCEEKQISVEERRSLFRQIPRISEELFHMKKDPSQLENLSFQTAHQDTVAELRTILFQFMEEHHDDAFLPEPLMMDYVAKTGLTPYEILREERFYPLPKLIAMYQDFLSGKELSLAEYGTSDCEKIALIRFYCSQESKQSFLSDYVQDENEVVSAYASYCLQKFDRLEHICQTSQNPYLLLWIADLISVLTPQEGMGCFHIIYERYFVDKAIEKALPSRYKPAMYATLNMISMRYGLQLPSEEEMKLTEQFWSKEMYEKSSLVLNALKL